MGCVKPTNPFGVAAQQFPREVGRRALVLHDDGLNNWLRGNNRSLAGRQQAGGPPEIPSTGGKKAQGRDGDATAIRDSKTRKSTADC